MLEKARQAERLATERAAAQDRYERFRQAVDVNDQLSGLAATHPSANPLPVLRSGVERLRALDQQARELRAALAGEVNVTFEVGAGAELAPALALGHRARDHRGRHRGGRPRPQRPRDREPRDDPEPDRRGHRGHRPDPRRGRPVDAPRRSRWTPSSGTPRSTVACAVDPRWKRSSRRSRPTPPSGSRRSASTDLASAEDVLAREEAHVAQIDVLTAQLEGLVGKQPPGSLVPMRDAAALEISEKSSALEALGPIAKEPRARERLEVEVRDQEGGAGARARRRGERPRPGRDERRRCRGGRRPTRNRSRAGASELAALRAPPARLHHDPRVHRRGGAGHDEVGDALPGEADGP